MRHPGAPSERELAEMVVRLQAVNAEMLEACRDMVAVLESIFLRHEDIPDTEDWAALYKGQNVIAKARGKES